MLSLYQPALISEAKFWHLNLRTTIATRLLRRLLLIVACTGLFCISTLRVMSLVQAATLVPVTTPVATRPRIPVAPTPSLSAALPPAASPASCEPFGTVPVPSALTLSTPGLLQLVDAPETYSIYGATSDEVTNQLRRCAPTSSEGTFSGATSYWIGTHYSYRLTDSGACHLSDISVGVHISQVLPSREDNGVSSQLDAKWDGYARNLTNHENGHTAIDIDNAQSLLNELSALPDLPCGTIAATASNVTAARLNALDAANDAYDASTGHGTTQGAIWQ